LPDISVRPTIFFADMQLRYDIRMAQQEMKTR
jgi:hypothetical protein